MRLLFVDDDPDSRALALRALRQEFPDSAAVQPVDMAGFEAALAEGPPDLFVTDYDLRWSDGFALYQRVRQACPDCGAIMFTGTGNEELAVKAIKAGFDDYIVKSPKQFRRLATAARAAVERRRENRALRDDKDLLLQELYHRLHNNLQIVISLMLTTARQVTDADARSRIQDLAQRIQSLSMLQEQLYRTEEFRRVDVRRYLERLTSEVLGLADGRVALRAELDEAELPVGTAVPFALIANELVANVVKHAFPGGRAGTMRVRLQCAKGTLTLRVADDGVGSSGGREGFGLHLVRRLASQIEASVVCESHGVGTECRVTVPITT